MINIIVDPANLHVINPNKLCNRIIKKYNRKIGIGFPYY